MHQSYTEIEAECRVGAIIRPNAEGRVVPEVLADAWEALVLSSSGVDAWEDIIRGIVVGLLVIIAGNVVRNQWNIIIGTLDFRPKLVKIGPKPLYL